MTCHFFTRRYFLLHRSPNNTHAVLYISSKLIDGHLQAFGRLYTYTTRPFLVHIIDGINSILMAHSRIQFAACVLMGYLIRWLRTLYQLPLSLGSVGRWCIILGSVLVLTLSYYRTWHKNQNLVYPTQRGKCVCVEYKRIIKQKCALIGLAHRNWRRHRIGCGQILNLNISDDRL